MNCWTGTVTFASMHTPSVSALFIFLILIILFKKFSFGNYLYSMQVLLCLWSFEWKNLCNWWVRTKSKCSKFLGCLWHLHKHLGISRRPKYYPRNRRLICDGWKDIHSMWAVFSNFKCVCSCLRTIEWHLGACRWDPSIRLARSCRCFRWHSLRIGWEFRDQTNGVGKGHEGVVASWEAVTATYKTALPACCHRKEHFCNRKGM